MEVWKFQRIKRSKNPWSSQVWKSGKENSFGKKSKNPWITVVWKFENLRKYKKSQKSLIFTSVKIWERNSVLKKSKNPLIPLCESLKIWGNEKKSKNPWS